MRVAAQDARVGDDVYGEDPSVNELESVAADILGMEAALFVPTGTMGNQIALLSHTDPGQEVVLETNSHIYNWEVGGLASNAGVVARPIDGGQGGLFSPTQLEDSLVTESLHRAGTGVVCVENTHNHAGGVAHGVAAIEELAAVLAPHDIPLHIDGARLFNAAVALGEDPAALARPADTVMVCVSKGLGAPVGSLLAGSAKTIDRARRQRKRLGGGMRQAGIIAAPALHGLQRWERLSRDHERARTLATGLDTLDGVSVQPPETNIVLVDIAETGLAVETFIDRCEDAGVQGVQFGDSVVRFCTHLDISDADVGSAIDRVESALAA